jgi:hypothetical protein
MLANPAWNHYLLFQPLLPDPLLGGKPLNQLLPFSIRLFRELGSDSAFGLFAKTVFLVDLGAVFDGVVPLLEGAN